jgi:hypothetical protein
MASSTKSRRLVAPAGHGDEGVSEISTSGSIPPGFTKR